jgi:hypothetical protein
MTWTPASSLKSGDSISTINNRKLTVKGIVHKKEAATVYNFEVENFHSYYVGECSAWVHNTSTLSHKNVRDDFRELDPLQETSQSSNGTPVKIEYEKTPRLRVSDPYAQIELPENSKNLFSLTRVGAPVWTDGADVMFGARVRHHLIERHTDAFKREFISLGKTLSPEQQKAFAKEYYGRRFVSQYRYDKIVGANKTKETINKTDPNFAYGKESFSSWIDATFYSEQKAFERVELSVDEIKNTHRLAASQINGIELGKLRNSENEYAGHKTIHTNRALENITKNPELTVYEQVPIDSDKSEATVLYTFPHQVKSKIYSLVDYVNESRSNGRLNRFELAADVQRGFISIHPFQDGNGRVSRILLDRMLVEAGIPAPINLNKELDIKGSVDDWRTEVKDGVHRTYLLLKRWSTSE